MRLVVEAFVAKKLVDDELMNDALDEKRFVDDAVVAKIVVVVALVNTVEEAINVPLVARTPRPER